MHMGQTNGAFAAACNVWLEMASAVWHVANGKGILDDFTSCHTRVSDHEAPQSASLEIGAVTSEFY